MTPKITLDFVDSKGIRRTHVSMRDSELRLLAEACFYDNKLDWCDSASSVNRGQFVEDAHALVNPPSTKRLYLFTEFETGGSYLMPIPSKLEAEDQLSRYKTFNRPEPVRALLLDLGSEVKLVAKLR